MNNLCFHLKTYGCQMNERDSEAVAHLLEEHGFRQVESERAADIIVLNTCSVRETAENKAIGKAGILLRLKRENPDLILIIMGCMAQNRGAELLRKIPHLDAVVGTDQLHQLPQVVEQAVAGKRRQARLATGTEIMGRLQGRREAGVSAFVSVMRGCDQYCSYCIVPKVRGREKSRPMQDIVAEVSRLAEQGCREVFLLGQNITAYGLAEARREDVFSPDISPFAELLQAVDQVPGIQRIRFTSPHPRHMNWKFMEAATGLAKVCESFHIPLQSGSDRILRAMRRGYDAADYLRCIERLRERLPNATFSTDVIVGFPGESEEDFAATRHLMEEVGFDMAYVFKYSPRSGTRAAQWPDDVPVEVKEQRNQILLDDLAARARRRNRRYVGAVLEVLLEGPSKRNRRRWSGRSRENKVCLVDSSDQLRPGQLVEVKITRSTGSSLFGEIVV